MSKSWNPMTRVLAGEHVGTSAYTSVFEFPTRSNSKKPSGVPSGAKLIYKLCCDSPRGLSRSAVPGPDVVNADAVQMQMDECFASGPSDRNSEKWWCQKSSTWLFVFVFLLLSVASGFLLMANAQRAVASDDADQEPHPRNKPSSTRQPHPRNRPSSTRQPVETTTRAAPKPKLKQPVDTSAPLLQPTDYIEQTGASISPGGNISLYVIGSSNVVWMTWIEQLHLYLARLGYQLPVVPAQTAPLFQSNTTQVCDNTEYFAHLRTSRFAKIGWHSWDFAYDDWSDCGADGYRVIANHKVKCEHGPGCAFGKDVYRVTDIARDASHSDVTLITSWFNDFEPEAHKCFGGTSIPLEALAKMSMEGLLRTIRAIHEQNPHVQILVMGKYDIFRHNYDPKVGELNELIKDVVEKEPNTVFVGYRRPPPGGWRFLELVQGAIAPHKNHLNCRGSKLLAFAVLERLYAAKILARSVKLVNPEMNSNLRTCSILSGALCRTSALCWVDPRDQKCKPYSGGSNHSIQFVV